MNFRAKITISPLFVGTYGNFKLLVFVFAFSWLSEEHCIDTEAKGKDTTH